jgi:ribosomal protein S18 acetylase RimI-like enzyme
MIRSDFIRRIEETSFNAWPALQTLFYDGWLLRFANDYTKRANSVNGLYAGCLPTAEKVAYCERMYQGQRQRPIFRLTPLVDRHDLDPHLQQRGYGFVDHTSVQLLDLRNWKPQGSSRTKVLSGPGGIDAWLQAFHRLNPQRRDAATHKLLLQNVLGALCLMVLKAKEEIVACGLAVADGPFVGLFDIVTAAEKRRQGYGLEMTTSLLTWGRSMNARHAYLQVIKDNHPALSLYRQLHFEPSYDYWYRVAPENLEEL